jgi:hypothetical protein
MRAKFAYRPTQSTMKRNHMSEIRQHVTPTGTPAESKAKRWTKRGVVVGALTVPMVALLGGQAGAAELTPIAQYLDSAVASTSTEVVSALGTLLGVK